MAELMPLSPGRLPPGVLEAADLLQIAGHSSHLVGGAVRDLLLGRAPEDWDLATAARPEEVRRILEPAGWSVVDTGVRYGTVTALRGPERVEVTTYRREAG